MTGFNIVKILRLFNVRPQLFVGIRRFQRYRLIFFLPSCSLIVQQL